MDDQHFDRLTRTLATRLRRRAVTATLMGCAFAALLDGPGQKAVAKKRRKKKKPKPSGCTPSCFNKRCGQDDGCGGACTVPIGCDATAACVNGRCVADVCPTCTGNHVCRPDGSCACPPGLRECGDVGYFGNCHECCARGPSHLPDPDCDGDPRGELCETNHPDFVLRCGCWGQHNCGGRCGRCCIDDHCELDFGPNSFCTADLACACPEGRTYCDPVRGCVNASNDAGACGPLCKICTSGFRCVNGACCTDACGTIIIPGQPCCNGTCTDRGEFMEPRFVCA